MSTNAGDDTEVELAYTLVEPNDAARFLAADQFGPFKASGKARPVQVEDRYVDTADGALARAGFAARLRRARSGSVLTVKSRASSRGPLQRRTELEGPAAIALDVASWPPSTARSLVLELCGDAPLGEIVTIRQVRRKRDLESDGTRAELTVDEVEIVSGGTIAARFCELEVELVKGDEQPLRELQEVCAEDARLIPSERSKFERALEAIGLVGARRSAGNRGIAPALEHLVQLDAGEAESPVATPDRTPAPARPDPPKGPGVRGDDTLAEAGRKTLEFHFARLLAREAGARDGSSPGELKSMRVATRRMRAAWRVFGDAFRPKPTRRLRSRLRDVAGRLGAVRDLDVLLEALESFQGGVGGERSAGLEPLVHAWREDREDKRRALVDVFDSDAYRELVDEYRAFFDADAEAAARRVVPEEPWRVRETASSRIWAAAEHVRAYEPLVADADPATLHRLRIATKRLRYTIEFFREALGPEAADLIARCVAVQDHLGLLNDANVTAGLVADFLVKHGDGLNPAETQEIAAYQASREADVDRLRREFPGPWSGIASPEFRARLAKAVAAL